MKKLMLFTLMLIPVLVQAELLVIGNSSTAAELSRRQIIDLYLGKVTVLPSGHGAELFEYGSGHTMNKEFYQAIIKRTENQILMNRQKQLISGKFKSPVVAKDQADLVAKVAATPNAVGYIDSQYLNDSVTVLFKLDE
ncbi:MAG: hypothetical protein KJ556_08415 [Gammaproteobacteria bacterium]|nr:hypothetical protein [Gammaproteobacteria bacterium]MBU2057074.1 hypothetical protein [Gammaproteobacteria bacterium]MBU2175133.1 hypothetical protein [Gammaproteobacteria bacterium]MBU2245164.1 hypothetical protein [Gammaproteobacteria bacterium]MBU2343969.1 hypothetical protein [Gammaproteobacteria bacterium]